MSPLPLLLGLSALIALPAATHYAVEGWLRQDAANQRLATLSEWQRQTEQSHRRLAAHQAFVARAKALLDKASATGATPQSWERFPVSLQRETSWDLVSRLLAQADHGPAFYYKPEYLRVDITATRDEVKNKATISGAKMADNSEINTQESTATVTLRGAFLVRTR